MYLQSTHTAAVQDLMRRRRELHTAREAGRSDQVAGSGLRAVPAPAPAEDFDYESLSLLPLAAPLNDSVPRTPADLPYAA